MASRSRSRRKSKARAIFYSILGFLAIGYLPTLILGDFRISLVVAAAATIPFGMRAEKLIKGLGRGAGLGLLAGVAIVLGLAHYQVSRDSIVTAQIAGLCVGSTTALCAATAGLFTHFARKRRQQMDADWK